MSLNARRFSAPSSARAEVIAQVAEAQALMDEFGQDAPVAMWRGEAVARDTWKFERSLYCCFDCDGPYRSFLEGCQRRGIQVPASEWAAVDAADARERQWEVDRAYNQYEDQLYAAAGFVREPEDPCRPWKGGVWVFPTARAA